LFVEWGIQFIGKLSPAAEQQQAQTAQPGQRRGGEKWTLKTQFGTSLPVAQPGRSVKNQNEFSHNPIIL
jgi:hypothetical protein